MRMAQETHPVKADALNMGAGTEHERLGTLLVAQGHSTQKRWNGPAALPPKAGSGLTAC